MRYRVLTAVLVFAVTLVLSAACANKVVYTGPPEILVKFKQGTSWQAIYAVHRRLGGQVKSIVSQIDVQVVEVPADRLEEILELYKQDPHVEYAEINTLMEVAAVLDTTFFSRARVHI